MQSISNNDAYGIESVLSFCIIIWMAQDLLPKVCSEEQSEEV